MYNTGFQWDLSSQALEMGGLISTSNRLIGVPCVIQPRSGSKTVGDSIDVQVLLVHTSDCVIYTNDFIV